MEKWRAPSERIRTASEIPIEVDLTDKDASPNLHEDFRKGITSPQVGMEYTGIAERLGVNVWMAERAARWGKTHLKRRESTPPY